MDKCDNYWPFHPMLFLIPLLCPNDNATTTLTTTKEDDGKRLVIKCNGRKTLFSVKGELGILQISLHTTKTFPLRCVVAPLREDLSLRMSVWMSAKPPKIPGKTLKTLCMYWSKTNATKNLHRGCVCPPVSSSVSSFFSQTVKLEVFRVERLYNACF